MSAIGGEGCAQSRLLPCGRRRRYRRLHCLLGEAPAGKSPLWVIPGIAALILFAWALNRIEVDLAGCAFAAYGGIYIAASLLWLWGVEGRRSDRWDLAGAAVCLLGAGIILLGPHS